MVPVDVLCRASLHAHAAAEGLGATNVADRAPADRDAWRRQARAYALLVQGRIGALLERGGYRRPWQTPGLPELAARRVGDAESAPRDGAAGPEAQQGKLAVWHLGEAVALAGEHLPLNVPRAQDALADARRALRAARKAYGEGKRG